MSDAGEGGAPPEAPSASLARRALALAYEALLLAALPVSYTHLTLPTN